MITPYLQVLKDLGIPNYIFQVLKNLVKELKSVLPENQLNGCHIGNLKTLSSIAS